jgi:glycosyltransferase 2 family protein
VTSSDTPGTGLSQMTKIAPAAGHVSVRHMLLLLKIVLSGGLIYYAFSKIDLHEAWSQIRNISTYAIVVMMALLFVEIVVASARLRQILALLGQRCRFIQALDVVFIGAFFSQTLISFVGGDAMRIWRIVRSKVSIGLAAKSVVLDRASGFAGLLVLVLLTLPFLLQVVTAPSMRFGLLFALLAGIAGFVVLACFRYMPAGLKRLRPLHWVADFSAAAVTVAGSTRGVGALLGLSLPIHVLNVVIIYFLALGLSINLTFWHCLLLAPPVLFLSMLPISVAGWGVREGAMIVALSLVGVSPAQSVAISVCFGLGVLAISLPGGLLWLVHRGEYATIQGDVTTPPTGHSLRDSNS